MKEIKLLRTFLFVAVAGLFIITACGPTQDVSVEVPSDAACGAIIDAKCVKCHYKTRICEALGTKSVRSWKKSIKFMVKQGAVLTEEEQSKVVACLSSLPAGSDLVCK